MKLSEFKTDSQKEVQGVWVDCADGMRLKLGRMNNKNMMKAIRVLTKTGRQALRTMSDDKIEPFMIKAVAQTVLLGWENIQEDDGTEMVYSPEKAEEALKVRDFYLLVVELASDPNIFKYAEELKDSEGNSSLS